MINEVQNKFAELGFRVEPLVDPETALITFDIVGRVDNRHEFDIEKKIYEVKKSKERNEEIQEII